MIDYGKRNVLGIQIDAVDYDAALDKIIAAAKQKRPLAVSALAVHGVMTGVLDPRQRHRLNQFDLLVPDGQPVRWALSWLHGARLADRVYGPTLMLETCRRAEAAGLPVFLYGGTQEMVAALRRNLRRKFPELRVTGYRPSKFRRISKQERTDVIAAVRASGAAITFVGLGCPRQEVFTYEMRKALSMPVLAVGAAFAFHAGQLAQAPAPMQKAGLEWFYRLSKEPRRLWRRYLYLNPMYLGLLALQRSRLRRFDPENTVPPSEPLLYG